MSETRFVVTLVLKCIGLALLLNSPLIIGWVGGMLGWWAWP